MKKLYRNLIFECIIFFAVLFLFDDIKLAFIAFWFVAFSFELQDINENLERIFPKRKGCGK